MDVEALDFVEAPLNYLVDTGETPVTYASVAGGDVSRFGGTYTEHTVAIRNGRPLIDRFDLDREGFLLTHHDSAMSDFYDDGTLARVYEPEVERLVRDASGASRVVVFDHTRRADAESIRRERIVREPARLAHNDYTDRSAYRRVRDILPAEADELLARRFAIINVWRPVRVPVETAPIALCDARTIVPEELIATERRAQDRIGETQRLLFNPEHRWFYFPDMQPNEALLFKCYDSATDGPARFTAPTAFVDPNTAPDATPRESIETRTFAFY